MSNKYCINTHLLSSTRYALRLEKYGAIFVILYFLIYKNWTASCIFYSLVFIVEVNVKTDWNGQKEHIKSSTNRNVFGFLKPVCKYEKKSVCGSLRKGSSCNMRFLLWMDPLASFLLKQRGHFWKEKQPCTFLSHSTSMWCQKFVKPSTTDN